MTQGTAKNLNLDGYYIGGKTGTAQKFINGEYSNSQFISSFASIFPTNNPRYVIIISIDSPIYGKHWANESAVPVTKNIINRMIIADQTLHQTNNQVILVNNEKIYNDDTSNYFPLIYTERTPANKVPNLRGKSLKEALEIANLNGIKLDPTGFK